MEGISGPALNVAEVNANGAIAGFIPSPPGGYGIYETNNRLFIIQNPDFDLSKSRGMQAGPPIIYD